MKAAICYSRSPLTWVKRRARRLQRFYGVERRLAIFDAWCDYAEFCLGRCAHINPIPGGRK